MNVQNIESLSCSIKQCGNINAGILFLIKSICMANEWPYGEVWKPDKNNQYLIRSQFWSGDSDSYQKFSKFSSYHKFAKGIGLVGKTWNQKKLLLLEEVTNQSNFLRSFVTSKAGFNSAISCPIFNNEKVICVLCFFMNKISFIDKENAELYFRYSETIGGILVNLN